MDSVKAFLQTLPNEHGKYTTLLLEGLQLEFFSQAMLLQSHIVRILVEDFGFPPTFNRLSPVQLDSPQACYANLPSDDARDQFTLLMDTQETVFAFNISLYDSTSLMFLVAVQLLARFGSSTHISLADQPVSIETARILAYDILGVSEYIKKLIHFAATLGMSQKIDPSLLHAPQMSELLLELTSENAPPRTACVNSHKIRLNASVRLFLCVIISPTFFADCRFLGDTGFQARKWLRVQAQSAATPQDFHPSPGVCAPHQVCNV